MMAQWQVSGDSQIDFEDKGNQVKGLRKEKKQAKGFLIFCLFWFMVSHF